MPGHQLCLITVLLILHMFTSGCSGFIIHRRQYRDAPIVDDGLSTVERLQNLLLQITRVQEQAGDLEQQQQQQPQHHHTEPTQTELPDKRQFIPDFGFHSRSQAGGDVSRILLAKQEAQDPFSYGRRKRDAALSSDLSLLKRSSMDYASKNPKSQALQSGGADSNSNMAGLHTGDVGIRTIRSTHRLKADDTETGIVVRRIGDDNPDNSGRLKQKTVSPENSVTGGLT